MKANQKHSIGYIFIVMFFGVIFGSVLNQFIAILLPEGVVKEFFTSTQSIGWGFSENNWVDLFVIRFKTGLFIDISVLSILGMGISWYFLRFFK